MTETIATSAAVQRHDAATLASLRDASKQMAGWYAFTLLRPAAVPGTRNPAGVLYFFDAIHHPTDDAYWRAFSIEPRWNKVAVPVLAFDGWYDAFLNGALRNFNGVQAQGATALARQNQRIVIGPWEHLGWGRPDSPVSPRLKAIGEVADSPVNDLTIAWFDHFLGGRGQRRRRRRPAHRLLRRER